MKAEAKTKATSPKAMASAAKAKEAPKDEGASKQAKASSKDISTRNGRGDASRPGRSEVKAPPPSAPAPSTHQPVGPRPEMPKLVEREPEYGSTSYRPTRPPPPMPRLKAQTPPKPSPATAPRMHVPPAKGYQPIVNITPFPRSTEPLNLVVGDKAVHPLHGLGEVISIEHREVGGISGDFYILRILDKGMRVMVPKASAGSSGLRAVMSTKDADAVLDTLRAREVAVDLQPWSRRFRAYTEMMKSGSPHEVAKVLRDMFRLKFDKDLSFGERRLLDQAKSLLMKELAAAKQMTEPELLAQVSEMFKA